MEKITFYECPELINPNIKIKDIKKIIKNKTGIKEENQRFHVYFNYINFMAYHELGDQAFWHYFEIKVYDKTRYYTHITKNLYNTDVILDLTKKIGELKQMFLSKQKFLQIDNNFIWKIKLD